jgi:hypothetical protein
MVKRFMLLPMNTAISNDDVHFVCDSVEEFYAAASNTVASPRKGVGGRQ